MDRKMTATSTGHEGHEVHLCHRCGWPFPNVHPSSKHRRAHKKVCGTVDGYKIIHSEDHDYHLPVSDDEPASDGDEHTPSPNLVKGKAEEFGSDGGVGEKSNKSEDDVFSDAVTDFSDSGISPQLQERLPNDKSVEQKKLEGDESLKVDETADKDDPTRSVETSNSGALVNVNNPSGSVVLVTDIPRDVSVDNIDEHDDGGSLLGKIQGEEDKFASVTLDSEEGKFSDPALIVEERKEELRGDTMVSEVVEHELPPHVENLQNGGDSAGVKSVAPLAQISSSTETVGKIALVEETHECIDDSVEVKEVSHSAEVSTQTSNAAEQVMLDSTMSSDNSTDFPSSCKVDGDARNLGELSKTESRDNGFEKSFEGLDTGNVSQVLHSVATAELNHDTGDIIEGTSNVVTVESEYIAGTVTELKDNNNKVVASEESPEQPIEKEPTSLLTDSKLLTENSARASESINAAEVSAQLDFEERHSSEDVSTSKPLVIVSSAEPTSDGNVVTSEKCSLPSVPLDFQDLHKTCATGDDKSFINAEDTVDDKPSKKDDLSATDLSRSSSTRSGSLEGNCGSISALSFESNMAVAETNSRSPDTLETNSQKHKTESEEARADKSDIFEPSFTTLVQSGSEGNHVTAASEIETVQNNQKPKADSLQAGWFPSLVNVVNESEGRKKNEEIIAKVTNWSPVRQHGPLKNLLNDVKSPNTKEVPEANPKNETESKYNDAVATTIKPVVDSEATAPPNKDMEEWNSPARYPIEIKKEKKKKGKSYWVPFVCCSSAHRDL